MSDLNLNTLGREVRKGLLARHLDWAGYVDVLAGGDLELAVPAPQGSRAGHLVVFTSRGKDIWVRDAHPNMCYSIESQ